MIKKGAYMLKIETANGTQPVVPPCIRRARYENITSAQIPSFCKDLVLFLYQQPLFDGKVKDGEHLRVICLQDCDDVRLFEIFNANANLILGKEKAWPIDSFAFGTRPEKQLRTVEEEDKTPPKELLQDRHLRTLEHGLTLTLSSPFPLALRKLENAYDLVLEGLRTGWSKSEENVLKLDSTKFYLFSKKAVLEEEAVLIRLLALRFSMAKEIECEEKDGIIYMGINKQAHMRAIDRFGFKLQD